MLKASFTPSFFGNMKTKIVLIFLALNLTWQRTDLRGRKKEKGGRTEQRRRGGEIKLDAEATQRRGHKGRRKSYTLCVYCSSPWEKNPMTQSDERATARASLNWEAGNNKNPLGVVCVCYYAHTHTFVSAGKNGSVSKKWKKKTTLYTVKPQNRTACWSLLLFFEILIPLDITQTHNKDVLWFTHHCRARRHRLYWEEERWEYY